MDPQSPSEPINPQQTQTSQPPIVEQEKTNHNKLILIVGGILALLIIAFGIYFFTQRSKQLTTTLPTIQTSPQPTTTPQPTLKQPSPTTLVDETKEWKTYTNTKYNFELEYPHTMYVQEGEGDSFAAFSYKPFSDDPYVNKTIFQFDTQYKELFDALFNAPVGSDVAEAHNAVGVIVKKLENLKIDGHDAVEYTLDGITNYVPERDGGRGGIGYEHKLIIKRDDMTYLGFTYYVNNKESMDIRDEVLNDIIASMQIN